MDLKWIKDINTTQQVSLAIAFLMVTGAITFITATDNDMHRFIGFIIMVCVVGICFVFSRKDTNGAPPKLELTSSHVQDLPGRYFIGIDIGRDKIDYCLLDYERFVAGKKHFKIAEGGKPTPDNFQSVYNKLLKIIKKVCEKADKHNITSISGIGLGLPGQVDPVSGELSFSPGFKSGETEPIKEKVRKILWNEEKDLLSKYFGEPSRQQEIAMEDLNILIDNDVRCSTRYLWKTGPARNMVCIFSGIGLGSGIVLGDKMLYGYKFSAGEIGHTTICDCLDSSPPARCVLGRDKYKCMCGMDGCHLEKFVSRGGMLNIAKNLDPYEYQRLEGNYDGLAKKEAYQHFLQKKEFAEEYLRKDGELTTYFLSLAFYDGDKYVCDVVKHFFRYLAIGIANYLNVINPHRVYLGGGMIKGFYSEKKESKVLGRSTASFLREEIKKYALPSASRVHISKREYTEKRIASIGAALLFKDESYFDYMNQKREVP